MKKEFRKHQRFSEIGRVECKPLCPLRGILDDISLVGCKIHFPTAVEVVEDQIYHVVLKINRHGKFFTIMLSCLIAWIKEEDENTFVGFSIKETSDQNIFQKYIQDLDKTENSTSDVSSLIIDDDVTFI